jgi:ATPase subunit of ABC transporter with duplicated ATPase domains
VDIERSVGSLSGGQKARVGLAALLIATTDLLIMDEPTNHLDSAKWIFSD